MAEREYAISTEDHRQVSTEALHHYYLVSMGWHKLLLHESFIERIVVIIPANVTNFIERHNCIKVYCS